MTPDQIQEAPRAVHRTGGFPVSENSVARSQHGESRASHAVPRGTNRRTRPRVDPNLSENGQSALRPSLEVVFTYEPVNVAPTVTASLAVDRGVVRQGDEVLLTFAATDPNPLDPLTFRVDGQEVGFATGSGEARHRVLMDTAGTFTFTAQVSDDEATVAAGSVTVEVLQRETTGSSPSGPILGTIQR